jgi:hypothetical protein
MPRTIRPYAFAGLAGCVSQTVARETGTLVSVCHGEQSGIESDPETLAELPWYTVCEAHGYLVGHRSLKLAREWAVEPTAWCEMCREAVKNRSETANRGV